MCAFCFWQKVDISGTGVFSTIEKSPIFWINFFNLWCWKSPIFRINFFFKILFWRRRTWAEPEFFQSTSCNLFDWFFALILAGGGRERNGRAFNQGISIFHAHYWDHLEWEGGASLYRMCSLTIECVLLLCALLGLPWVRRRCVSLQNVFSYYRMCSLTIECVLLL